MKSRGGAEPRARQRFHAPSSLGATSSRASVSLTWSTAPRPVHTRSVDHAGDRPKLVMDLPHQSRNSRQVSHVARLVANDQAVSPEVLSVRQLPGRAGAGGRELPTNTRVAPERGQGLGHIGGDALGPASDEDHIDSVTRSGIGAGIALPARVAPGDKASPGSVVSDRRERNRSRQLGEDAVLPATPDQPWCRHR